MKARVFFVLAAATVLLASCVKDKEMSNPSEFPAIQAQISVGIDNALTKTYMGDLVSGKHKVYWSNGDQIRINGIESAALKDIPANTQTATFTFASTPSVPYNVLYPASDWTNSTQITLPDTQVWKDGNFADGMVPMSGYSADGSNIAVKYLCAVIKVPVLQAGIDADTDALACVRFRGRNSEQVKGLFGINYSTGVLTAASNNAADREVRVYQEVATSTTEPAVFYITVPAGTYSKGFDVIVQDEHNDCMTKSKTGSINLQAGNIYNLAEFEFIPDGTIPEADLVIDSAEKLVEFATKYNNKEYDDIAGSMVVKVTSDLTFNSSTSAAFNATGGIGLKKGVNGAEADYYFKPFFDGGGHTIKGLTATVPLFLATQSSGTIKDLTIDKSCSFTFTHTKEAEFDVGAVVGYHRGKLINVNVAADVSLAAVESVDKVTALGGLVGRVVVGSVVDCDYSGNIVVPAGFQSAAQEIYIGGLVGEISNADGRVKDSSFTGTIDNEGQMIAAKESDEFKGNPHLMIGGIIGLNTGTIDNCTVANHATGITVVLNDGSDHPYTGTVVTHSTNAYHYAIAGIAGRNDGTVKDCTNNAGILNIFSADRGDGGNMNGRYFEVAGIVGFNASEKTVSGCVNNGAIITRANPKMQYVGGVVAWNYGTVSSCENSSSATITMGTSHLKPYGARMSYVGGIIGDNRSSGKVSNVLNNANITVSRVENTTGVAHRIGGIFGQNDADIDGSEGGSIINTGEVYQTNGVDLCAAPNEENDYGYFLGGIVGYSKKSIKNVSNSGAVSYKCTANGKGAQYVHVGGVIGKLSASETVDVEKCTNTADVTFTASATHKSDAGTRYYYNYLGGIVGYAYNANIKGDSSKKSSNSGIVKGGDGSDNNNQPTPSFAVGGIVGYITGASSISYCQLSGNGQSYNDHWSNRGIGSYDCPSAGGIVGQILGTEEVAIPVSNCEIASTAIVFGRRGAVGGIAGLVQYASISNSAVPINMDDKQKQSGFFYGGIVAAAKNSTISGCAYTGASIKSSQLQIGGGIIGQLDTESVVDNCSSSVAEVSKNGTAVETTGGIAGKSVEGSTIKNSHYKSGMAICGDSNFTNGGGNSGDL